MLITDWLCGYEMLMTLVGGYEMLKRSWLTDWLCGHDMLMTDWLCGYKMLITNWLCCLEMLNVDDRLVVWL